MLLDYAKKCERNMILSSVLVLILGMVLAFEPQNSIKVISAVIAGIFCLIGFVFIIVFMKQDRIERMQSFSLVLGVILIGIGVFLFINIASLVNFITLLIGIAILIKSLFKVQFAMNLKGLSDKWFYNLIVGMIGCAIGVLLLFNPWDSLEMFLRVIGVILAIGSLVEIVEVIIVLKSLDNVKEAMFEELHPVVSKKNKNVEEIEEVKEED